MANPAEATRIDVLELKRYTANPETSPDSDRRFVATVNNTIVYWDGTQWAVLGTGGAGGANTWEQLYSNDSTFNVNSGTGFVIAGGMASTPDVLTVTVDAGSSGDAIQITQAGSGADIKGTSDTWNVSKTGVATFAGISISGTASAVAYTGAAVVTILDNSATSYRITPSGGPVMLTFDTSNSAEVLSTNALTFQVTSGLAELIQASNTISALRVTNNTITTFGANANSAGAAVIRSTSLTTGSLLQLQIAEGTINGGFYLTARDSTGSTNVFTVGKFGAHVIAGNGGTTVFTVTAGDLLVSDGSLLITDADNASTLVVTNATATSAVVADIAVAGLTSGSAFRITAGTATFTTGGKLIELTSTAAVAGNLLTATTTGAYTGTGMILVTAGAATTGVLISAISTTGLTSGSLFRATSSTAGAIATNGAVSIRATGAFTSTANVGFVDILASAVVTGGTVLRVASSGASQTTTEVLRVDASGFTTGYTGSVATFTSSSTTGTGNIILVTAVNTVAGDALKIVSNAMTLGAATMINLSHTTSVLGAGTSMLRLTSTSIDTGTTTGTMLDIAATAATAAHLVIITSASLTTGIGIKITLAGLTTGSAIDTTGVAATKQNFNMNASTGSTAAPQTNAPTGFFKIGIGGTDQWVPYYNAT